MIFFPAIDIKEGKCIRLKKGLLKDVKFYNNNPIEQAKEFEKIGCSWIHVVDIDGAFLGSPINHKIIFEIKKHTRCKIQVGGGIRDLETIQKFLNNSVDILSLIDCPITNPTVATNVATILGNQISERTKTSVDKYPNKTGIHPTNKRKPMASTNSLFGIFAAIR